MNHLSMDQRAEHYLSTFASGGRFQGGLSFPTALDQSRLDFTLASLDRVDYLLDRIRRRFKPTAAPFLRHAANQNFLYFLCFYVGSVVAREGALSVRWLDYESLMRLVPASRYPLEHGFATSVGCLLSNGAFFFPLVPISDRLFVATPEVGVRLSAEKYMR